MGRLPTGAGARVVVVDPDQPTRVYAASENGVYRSDDAGQSWAPASQGLQGQRMASLAVDPSRSRRLYALTMPGAVYVSEDGADSWRPTQGP